MPIYEYQCQSCGNELEVLQKFSDQPPSECPKCGKSTLIKKVSAAGFQLKGGGWYATDYKESKKPPAAEGTVEKTETKPDTKTEAPKPTEEKKPPKDSQ